VPGIKSKQLMNFSGYSDELIWNYLYCCNTDIFKPKFEKNKSKYFIFVGRLEKEKNIIGLVKGFKEFYKDNNDYRLVVIGNGSQRSFLSNVDGIDFLGWKSSSQIIKYLVNSNGFILPSIYEPWGVVVHEAASCGIPLLLSKNIGSKYEFLVNNYNGKLFDPFDPFDLANAMRYVKENNIDNVMGNRSYEISKHLNIDSWTTNLLMNAKDSKK
jgi:glycosyltransferase involved in cell wall biosynthesis